MFSVKIGGGEYQQFFNCRSCMCSAGFCEFHFIFKVFVRFTLYLHSTKSSNESLLVYITFCFVSVFLALLVSEIISIIPYVQG